MAHASPLARAFVVAATLALATQPALAGLCAAPDPGLELAEADLERLEDLDRSRTRAMAAAAAGGAEADRAVMGELYAEGVAPVDASLLEGEYDCRTIKMGGLTPIVVYQWFRCRVTPEAQAFTITKITGSQNFTGTLFASGDGYLYRGAGNYADEEARYYGQDAERDQVGCLAARSEGERHFVLELPRPRFESFHDAIELRPR
ncbi:DUF4893 domain-containing protein [Arsenicitalea aurantiaca]|uniref:DUF4893 domain-containing protein n=1 Tax=Arsenicitalea aurantiaca TaxID=1783274 RepID=A0A433X5I0_9HYPH|nr:DUF4893 domain-containing protein [Arsenicitalea aurantiaca]RUT29335.1 DUF4893 domain-containing protein [Arsenicitalea aurantiaca]